MNSRRHLILTAGMLALPATAFGQFTFDAAAAYAVGSQPSDVAIGDFNGDTIADIAATVDNQDRIVILNGTGGGGFVMGATILLGGGTSPQDIVAGDLDGDRDIDLAVGLKGPNQVRIYLNQGGGSFAAGASYSTGQRPLGMDIGDHDGDLDLDLCVANRDTDDVTILTNAGNGTFSVVTLAAGIEPRAAAFGDFDGDNDLDVAVSCHDDRTVRLYTNTGGSFAQTGSLSTGAQLRPEGIDSADLNGDQLDDIATASNGNGLEMAQVFLASGGGAFGAAANYPTGGSDTSHIVLANFDCDADVDLATSNRGSNNASVLENVGGGVFGAATLLAGGIEPENITAGDLDGDQVMDIAMANRTSGDVTVHINQTCDVGGGYTLSVSGMCPGQITVTWSGATPGVQQGIVFGLQQGSTTIPNGNPCAGSVLGVRGSVRLVSPPGFFSTGTGSGNISGNAGQASCGHFLQLVEGGSCAMSNVASIP